MGTKAIWFLQQMFWSLGSFIDAHVTKLTPPLQSERTQPTEPARPSLGAESDVLVSATPGAASRGGGMTVTLVGEDLTVEQTRKRRGGYLARYYVGGRQIFSLELHVSGSIDGARLGKRGRMLVSFYTPDNWAMWGPPQAQQ